MPGRIRTSPRRARRICISEKISPLPTYRNGKGRRNAASRKIKIAMFTQVTHPMPRRYLGGNAPRSSSRAPSLRPEPLRYTPLRGLDARSVQAFRPRVQRRVRGAGCEVGEQGRGDLGDPAWCGEAVGASREAGRENEDVRVAGVQGAVVAPRVERAGDLAKGVTRGGREHHVPTPGREEAPPQTLQGVRVLAVPDLILHDLHVEGVWVAGEVPYPARAVPCFVPRTVSGLFFGTEPDLPPQPPDHSPAILPPGGEVDATAGEQVRDDLRVVYALCQVEKSRPTVGDRHYLRPGPKPGPDPDAHPVAEDASKPDVAAPVRQEGCVPMVR